MRVVLDANVVIAAAASRGLCEAVFEVCLERHQVVTCAGLLDEVSRKLVRKLRLPRAVVDEYVRLLRDHAELLEPEKFETGARRDPADDMVLGLVAPGRVETIISGDNDLLVLKRFGNARIITPREFWDSTRAERG